MKLGGWQRLWTVVSIIILIIFVLVSLLLFPKRSEITSRWVYETIDVVKEPGEYSWTIRGTYKDYGDEELIERIHEKYIKEKPLTKVVFSGIDQKYKNELSNLPKEQTKHILIGLAVYFCLITLIYIFGWAVGWVYRGFKGKQVGL